MSSRSNVNGNKHEQEKDKKFALRFWFCILAIIICFVAYISGTNTGAKKAEIDVVEEQVVAVKKQFEQLDCKVQTIQDMDSEYKIIMNLDCSETEKEHLTEIKNIEKNIEKLTNRLKIVFDSMITIN